MTTKKVFAYTRGRVREGSGLHTSQRYEVTLHADMNGSSRILLTIDSELLNNGFSIGQTPPPPLELEYENIVEFLREWTSIESDQHRDG